MLARLQRRLWVPLLAVTACSDTGGDNGSGGTTSATASAASTGGDVGSGSGGTTSDSATASSGGGVGYVVSGDVGVFQSTEVGVVDVYVGLKATCDPNADWVVVKKNEDLEHGGVAWGTGWSVADVADGSYQAYAFADVDDSAEGTTNSVPDAGDWVPQDGGAVQCTPVEVAGADVSGVIVELDATL